MTEDNPISVSPDAWVKLLTGDDFQCMLAIGLLTYVLFRLRVREWICFVAPVLAGGVWGVWNAMEQHWAVGAHILKGFYVNGAGAALAAFGVHKAMDRLFGKDSTRVGTLGIMALVALVALSGCGSDEHDYRDCVFTGNGSACCYTDCSDDGRDCDTVCD